MCLGKFPQNTYEGERVVGSCATSARTPLFCLHLELLVQIVLNHLSKHLADRLGTEWVPCWMQNQHDVKKLQWTTSGFLLCLYLFKLRHWCCWALCLPCPLSITCRLCCLNNSLPPLMVTWKPVWHKQSVSQDFLVETELWTAAHSGVLAMLTSER